jgi:8-oxo-dGTP pyrophosphatase MutT (NUDIX family)
MYTRPVAIPDSEREVAPMGHSGAAERRTDVAYVLVKLRVRGAEHLLLNAHRKWGDWSLIGGHVEPSDSDWHAAAVREASEELAPLRYGEDIEVGPDEIGRLEWGPVASRSAGGALTEYRARCYALRFKSDPRACLSRLSDSDFVLLQTSELANEPRVSSVVERAARLLPGGWSELPLAWNADLDDLPLRRARAALSAHVG